MTVILFIWTAGLISTALLFIACVRGWIVNLFFLGCAIADALKDVGCQLFIDVEKIWKREKKIHLDETEEFYHE